MYSIVSPNGSHRVLGGVRQQSQHWVAVPEDRDEEPVRRFGAFTADLYALAAWLRQCQIETVVMESTGVYWIALFEVLEERGCDVKLVDAHYARQVPGRKTDVEDLVD